MSDKLGPYVLGLGGEREGIYCGDSRLLMKAVPDGSVDIVFTSPPYNTKMNYEEWNDDLPPDGFWEFQRSWLTSTFRVTKVGGRLYAVVSDVMLWRFKPLAEDAGWRFHQLLVWCKPNLVGGGRINKDWNLTAEWCLLFHKKKRTRMQQGCRGTTTHNWLVAASTQSNFTGWLRKVHPAQMPLKVALAWLSRTPGQVVLDPFVGCGTTAQAAKMLGRRWLGFEIGTATADLARQRIRDTQPPLPALLPEHQEELGLT